MVIDDENAKASKSLKSLKFTKTKGNDAAGSEKCKEPSKVGYYLAILISPSLNDSCLQEEPSGCTHCGVNSHPFADCPEKAHVSLLLIACYILSNLLSGSANFQQVFQQGWCSS